MKKFLALVLCTMMIFAVASEAFAATKFNLSTDLMSGFPCWTEPAVSTGKNWHIEWDAEATNIQSDRRAVVRALSEDGNSYASSLFVYSSESEAYHPYKAAYINSGNSQIKTRVGGRKDDRDGAAGTLFLVGYFFN